ncbi:hypothetical protein AX17_004145 [Amanita inopinata Kibby_2008]|nr:hypothetical protein AX17_004145 [Amanita inopinata Kibby_2008]
MSSCSTSASEQFEDSQSDHIDIAAESQTTQVTDNAADARGDQATINNTDAPKPFDSSAQADVILRSSDSVDFFVVKSLLCLVSPIFKDMFSLNQGKAREQNEMRNGVPVVPLEEDSETLNNLLLLIYPYAQQPTSKTDVLIKMAEATQKYGMDEIEGKLRQLFLASQVMVDEPLRAFCVGMHSGWDDVVKAAALNTLSLPQRDLWECDELELLKATDYHKLLQWRFECEDAVDELFKNNFYMFPGLLERLSSSKWSAYEARKAWKESCCPRGTGRLKKSLLQGMGFRPGVSAAEQVETCDVLLGVIDRAISKVPFDMRPRRATVFHHSLAQHQSLSQLAFILSN